MNVPAGVIQVIEFQDSDVSKRFRRMAESIDHNNARAEPMPFAGAVVIVPPKDGGDPVELLLLDEKADPAQFWATVLTRVQMRINEVQEAQQKNLGPFRR